VRRKLFVPRPSVWSLENFNVCFSKLASAL